MSCRTRHLGSSVLIILLFLTATSATSRAQPPTAASPTGEGLGRDRRCLYLRTGTVNLREKRSLLAPGAKFDQRVRYVMQLDGPMTPERRSRLEEAGVALGTYLPMHAYVVRLDGVDADALMALGFVTWLGPYEDSWKVSPDIGRAHWQSPERRQLAALGKKRLVVELFPDADVDTAAADVKRFGATVQSFAARHGNRRLTVDVNEPGVKELRRPPDVMFIEEAAEAQPRNATTTWICQSNMPDIVPLWDAGLHGEDQIAGIIDWDLRADQCAFQDETNPIGPLHRKIQAYYGMGINPGYGWHGTHVGGVLAADELANTEPDLKGMAYKARFVFQHYNGVTAGGVLYVNDRLTVAHSDGARVHSNSWGSDSTSEYNAWARDIDLFTRNNEDDLVAVAVTNANALVKVPENAKNCLAVAATQDTPYQDLRCYGGYGPTADGRQKPEVWAPGCGSISADYYTQCGLHTGGGTSYATPAVSGMAVLARQYFMQGFYPGGTANPQHAFTPSGALLKALMINSAEDMTGFDGYFSPQEGWGRILMSDSLCLNGGARRLLTIDTRNADGLSTGQTDTYLVKVNGSGQRLKITLVWTDVPAALSAAFTPVNNLDLVVTDPGSITYLGNVFSNGESATGGSADALNNAEQVQRAAPSPGLWQVDVTGAAVNQDLQGYALVITGDVAWQCLKGDVNQDGVVDGADIQPFISVLLNGGGRMEVCAADMNSLNGPGVDDIPDFVAALLGNGS